MLRQKRLDSVEEVDAVLGLFKAMGLVLVEHIFIRLAGFFQRIVE